MSRCRTYYRGVRAPDGVRVWRETVLDGHLVPGSCQSLDPRNDLRDHSPDGFEWGYGGSGPSQLALALTADMLRDDRLALASYRALMPLVGAMPHGGWTIADDDVRRAIAGSGPG